MDRSYLAGILVASALMIITFSVVGADDIRSSQANVKIDEDYYQNDIESAVQEAQRNPRSRLFDYSNRYWYNRTTAESFTLPPLGSHDLEDARLEGGIAATAAGDETNKANPDLPEDEQADLVQTHQETEDQENLVRQNAEIRQAVPTPENTGPVLIVDRIEHNFPNGETVNINGIYSSGTLTSTPRE